MVKTSLQAASVAAIAAAAFWWGTHFGKEVSVEVPQAQEVPSTHEVTGIFLGDSQKPPQVPFLLFRQKAWGEYEPVELTPAGMSCKDDSGIGDTELKYDNLFRPELPMTGSVVHDSSQEMFTFFL